MARPHRKHLIRSGGRMRRDLWVGLKPNGMGEQNGVVFTDDVGE